MKKKPFLFTALLLSWMLSIDALPALSLDSRPSSKNEDAIKIDDYCDFLNEKATSDLNHRYHWKMGDGRWKILRSGAVGNYHYEVIAEKENMPATFLSYTDVVQYCAWKNSHFPSSILYLPYSCDAEAANVDKDLKSSALFFSCVRAAAATEQNSSQWGSGDDCSLLALGIIGLSCAAFCFNQTVSPVYREARISKKPAEEKNWKVPETLEVHIKQHWEIVDPTDFPKSPSCENQLNDWEASKIAYPEGQKKKIDLFKNFAARGTTLIMSGYATDAEGNMITIEGNPPPETLGGTAVHVIVYFNNQKSHLTLFETALKEEYGPKMTNELLTPERRKNAVLFGLSNNLVFDCLKEGVAKRVNQCIKNLHACNSENNDPFQEKENLLAHAQELAMLLETAPNALPEADSMRPTTTTEAVSYLTVKSIDVTMTAQSTVAWTRRALWLMQQLGFL